MSTAVKSGPAHSIRRMLHPRGPGPPGGGRFPFGRPVVILPFLAAVYVLTGSLGLQLATLHQSATLVWPPSGIALASLLVWGKRVWPGIFAGAFLVNFINLHHAGV